MLLRASEIILLYPAAFCLRSYSFLSLLGHLGLLSRKGFSLSSFCFQSSFSNRIKLISKCLQLDSKSKLSKIHYFLGFFKEVALFKSYLLSKFKPIFSFFIISYLWWVLKMRSALASKFDRSKFN
jgi:hypothetical protein